MSDIAAARKRKRCKAEAVAPNAGAGARKSARASVVSDAPTTTRNEAQVDKSVNVLAEAAEMASRDRGKKKKSSKRKHGSKKHGDAAASVNVQVGTAVVGNPVPAAVAGAGAGDPAASAPVRSGSGSVWRNKSGGNAAAVAGTPSAAALAAAAATAVAVSAPEVVPSEAVNRVAFPDSMVVHSWKEKGPQFKKGHWKPDEDARLREAIDRFAESKGWDEKKKLALAEDHKHAPEMRGAWLAIAGAFRDRTVRSVYNRGVRLLHTGNYKGSWTADEEASLMKLVDQIGPKWAEIGKRIGRMPSVARIKWERIKDGDSIRKGAWSSEEELKLMTLVTEDNNNDKYFRSQINWQQVSAGIKTRTASQCMTKWYATRLQMATVGGMWSQGEDARLIHAVAAQHPTSLRSVAWRKLRVKQASQQCRKHFTSMIKGVPDSQGRTFAQKLAFLQMKHPETLIPDDGDVEPAVHEPIHHRRSKKKRTAGAGADATPAAAPAAGAQDPSVVFPATRGAAKAPTDGSRGDAAKQARTQLHGVMPTRVVGTAPNAAAAAAVAAAATPGKANGSGRAAGVVAKEKEDTSSV